MLIVAMVGLQGLSATEADVGPVPLTARFITAADLADDSPILDNMKDFVGAVGESADAKWLEAKGIMNPQIANNVIRRVLFLEVSN